VHVRDALLEAACEDARQPRARQRLAGAEHKVARAGQEHKMCVRGERWARANHVAKAIE